MPTLTSHGFTLYSRPIAPDFTTRSVDGWTEDPAEALRSAITAAVRLSMRGDKYGEEDRAEAVAAVLAQVLTGLTGTGRMPQCNCGGPADYRVLAVDDYGNAYRSHRYLCVRHRNVADSRRMRVQDFPQCDLPFRSLCQLASKQRRALDRQRARDDAAAADAAAAQAFSPATIDEWDGGRQTLRTAAQCHRTALQMLADLGCRPLRKGDGNLYATAYSAARSGTLLALDVDAPGETIADELAIGHDALRAAISRAPKRVPSAPGKTTTERDALRRAHRDALYLPGDDAGRKVKASKSRTDSATLGDSARRDSNPSDVPIGPVTEQRHMPSVPSEQPNWTLDLPRNTALRLDRAATNRRKRAADKSAAQREMDRLSAGLAPRRPVLGETIDPASAR